MVKERKVGAVDRKKDYTTIGITAFLTAAAVMLLYDTLFGGKMVFALVQTVKPILYGAFIAYLLAPMVNFFERNLFRLRPGGNRRLHAAARVVSMLLSWVVVCFFFYLLASVLLPELYKSVQQMIANAYNY